MEQDILLTRTDGSVRRFRIYGGLTPHAGDVITLPVNRKPIRARIDKVGSAPSPNSETLRSLDHCDAIEI